MNSQGGLGQPTGNKRGPRARIHGRELKLGERLVAERRRPTVAKNSPFWGEPDDRRFATWAEEKREHRTDDHWNWARPAVDCLSAPYPSWLRDLGWC